MSEQRTLQERHRKLAAEYEYAMQNFQFDRVLNDGTRQNPNSERFRQSMSAHLEAAATLDAQFALLAEVKTALEPFATMANQVDEWQKGTDPKVNFEFSADALRNASTVLAKLKAVLGATDPA